MKKIFHNVLHKLNEIVIEEKNIFKNNILNLIEKDSNKDLTEYCIDNNVYYWICIKIINAI